MTSEAAITTSPRDYPQFGVDDEDRQVRKRLKSPTTSIKANNHEQSPSPTKQSKSRPGQDDDLSEFPDRPPARGKGRLWTEGDLPADDEDPSVTSMIKKPEARPISQEQLVAEVKGIYAGLVMVESKCIQADDNAQNAEEETAPTLNNEQWQALITTHRTLLHEHHDFFLASQHPSASPALRYLASKYGARPAMLGTKSFSKARLDYTIPPASGSWAKPGAGLIRERRYLEVVINGKVQYALPDTGVRENVITHEHALSLGANIESSHERRFRNARGQAFRSIGTTRLHLSFTDDPTKKLSCNFDVVETLAVPLVLGNRFLEITRTLKEYTHRLVKKTLSFVPGLGNKKIFTFMHMDSPRQKLGCHLDAELIFADVDTGSHLNLVSPDLVELHGWEVIPLTDEEAWVMLADGEMVRLEGYVETTLGVQDGCTKERFYVLDGLTCGAVIGDSTIESLDLFNKFGDSLIDLDLVEERDNFHNIAWVDTSSALNDIEKETDRLLTSYNERYNNVANQPNGWKRLLPRPATQEKQKAQDTIGEWRRPFHLT